MITTVTLNASIDKAYVMDKPIQNGTVMRVSKCHNTAGGKGLNVARAIKTCGEDVLATGLVGGYNGRSSLCRCLCNSNRRITRNTDVYA